MLRLHIHQVNTHLGPSGHTDFASSTFIYVWKAQMCRYEFGRWVCIHLYNSTYVGSMQHIGLLADTHNTLAGMPARAILTRGEVFKEDKKCATWEKYGQEDWENNMVACVQGLPMV
jgi:hypothetical protein